MAGIATGVTKSFPRSPGKARGVKAASPATGWEVHEVGRANVCTSTDSVIFCPFIYLFIFNH